MSIADELRTAGLDVIEGRPYGRMTDVGGVDVLSTGTGRSHECADDINNIVTPARGTVYLERSGRVWLLADGPVGSDENATVFLAQYRDEGSEEQADALAVVLAVLDAAYATASPITASDAVDGEIGADPVDPEEDSE